MPPRLIAALFAVLDTLPPADRRRLELETWAIQEREREREEIDGRPFDILNLVYTLLSMWTVRVEKAAEKALAATTPDVRVRFEAWLAIVTVSGPQGLRAVKGFHDEKLAGKLADKRSSRLGLLWRVIYSVDGDAVTVTVEKVTPHVYK